MSRRTPWTNRHILMATVHLETLIELGLNGRVALERVIAASAYGSALQAVAALTVFSHPQTVAQVGPGAAFATVRNAGRRGQIVDREGRPCAYDDNKSPTDAFLWANGIARRRADVQFNHLYQASDDPGSYTALQNLCVTPTFLAKLTDTDPVVRAHLQYRAFELYGWTPAGRDVPCRPDGSDDLVWAPTLAHADQVEQRMRAIMLRRPKDRTVQIAAAIGWRFSGFEPDERLKGVIP